jgi:hypothetical protein
MQTSTVSDRLKPLRTGRVYRHVRKSVPVLVAAALIWLCVGQAYAAAGHASEGAELARAVVHIPVGASLAEPAGGVVGRLLPQRGLRWQTFADREVVEQAVAAATTRLNCRAKPCVWDDRHRHHTTTAACSSTAFEERTIRLSSSSR